DCPLWSRTIKHADCSSTDQGGGKRRAGISCSCWLALNVFHFGGILKTSPLKAQCFHSLYFLLGRPIEGTSLDRRDSSLSLAVQSALWRLASGEFDIVIASFPWLLGVQARLWTTARAFR